MIDPVATIEALYEARAERSLDALRAELEALAPLPAEASTAWDDEDGDAWRRTAMLEVFARLIAERAWTDGIPLVLARMCLGDPGETMRRLPGYFEVATAGAPETLRAFLLTALASGPPGARWWAAQELPRSRSPDVVPPLVRALGDDEPMVREGACGALATMAVRRAELRGEIRSALVAAPASKHAARALAEIDEADAVDRVQAGKLEDATAGRPIETRRTVRRCALHFRPRCPRTWERLTPTATEDVRRCNACAHDVQFCATDAETIARAIAGGCIARDEPHESELSHHARETHEPELVARQREANRLVARERAIADVISGSLAPDFTRCPTCAWPQPSWHATCRVCGAGTAAGP